MQPPETTNPRAALQQLLPYGAIADIARQLRMSHTAVAKALLKARPTHPAVVEAVRRIQASDSQAIQHELEKLTH